jgi:ABC-type multidrug transport system fused ATPase/permease subunit
MRLPPRSLFNWKFSYFRLWREAWVYASAAQRRTILFYHGMYALAIGVWIIRPYLLGKLVNTLQTGGSHLFHDCAVILGQIFLCNLVFWSFHGPGRVLERRTAKQIYITYTDTCYTKLSELPLKWHQGHHSGSTINRIQTSASGLQDFVQTGFVSIQNLGELAGAIIMLLWFSPVIGIVSLSGFVLSLLIMVAVNKHMIAALHASNEAAHQANATFYDFVSNMVSIIILRLQKFSAVTLHSKLGLSMAPWMRQIKLNEGRYFIYTMMNVTMMTVILLGYIWSQIDTHAVLAAGSLVTIYLYQERVGMQGFGFIGLHADWLKNLTSLTATKHILEDHANLVHDQIPVPAPDWKMIDLRDVCFDYNSDTGETKAALRNVTLSMKHGERIALMGGSGGGKTTLLSVLRALHEPQSAHMLIDGAAFPFKSLAEITTLIPQDPEIFENTIRFNVSFGLDVPDAKVYHALALAEFMPVLDNLPQGLDTDIREKGVNLSVGQKQRLALARGIFAAEQSDIILLDEPTSSIDLPTEEKIFENVFAEFKDKTIVATLHRLHLLPRFDRIIYLENGEVTLNLPAQQALTEDNKIRQLYLAYQSAGQ